MPAVGIIFLQIAIQTALIITPLIIPIPGRMARIPAATIGTLLSPTVYSSIVLQNL